MTLASVGPRGIHIVVGEFSQNRTAMRVLWGVYILQRVHPRRGSIITPTQVDHVNKDGSLPRNKKKKLRSPSVSRQYVTSMISRYILIRGGDRS